MPTVERLLRDAMTAHAEEVPQLWVGTARTVLRRSRRSTQLSLAAVGAAAVLAVVGVTSYAVSAHSGPSTPPSGQVAPSGPATPDPIYSGFREVGSAIGGAPADLMAVTLTSPVPTLGLKVDSNTYDQDQGNLVKYIGFSRPGSGVASGVVIVTEGSVTPPHNPASPSPSTVSVTIAGRPAAEWTSGGDRWVYFTAGALTVEVYAIDQAMTTEQLVTVAGALRGLP
jgi:hypothetical protein